MPVLAFRSLLLTPQTCFFVNWEENLTMRLTNLERNSLVELDSVGKTAYLHADNWALMVLSSQDSRALAVKMSNPLQERAVFEMFAKAT